MIFDVLVKHAGASPYDKRMFVMQHSSGTGCQEWRFQGLLGFGGKYWSETNTVNCYREDMTDERREVIERTNAALARLAQIDRENG